MYQSTLDGMSALGHMSSKMSIKPQSSVNQHADGVSIKGPSRVLIDT